MVLTVIQVSRIFVFINEINKKHILTFVLIINHYSRIIAVLGLFFISIGAGGIRPLFITFAGDQFKFPQQQQQFQHYIIRYILALDLGALLSSILTPKFKHSVHCFGKNSCYPLAFGVSALMLLIAVGNY